MIVKKRKREEEEEINKLKRDDPVVIKSRMIFVCSSILLLLVVFYFNIHTVYQLIGVEYTQFDQTAQGEIIKKASLIQYVNQTFQVVLLYCVLYSSQIIDNFLFEKYDLFNTSISLKNQQRKHLTLRKLVVDMIGSSILDIWSVRNYIFAPVTEEIVFTAMILYNYQNINSWKLSLFFGIPHLHHAFELYADIDNSHYTVMTILLTCGFQFLYTFVFGHINNIFYLKNNQNLLCCIVSHSICNYMGFPNIAPLFDFTSVSKSKDKQQQLERLNKIYKYSYWSLMLFGLIQYIKYLAA